MPSWMDEGGSAAPAAPPEEEAPPAPEEPAPEPEAAPMPEAAAEALIKGAEPAPEEAPPPPAPEEPAPEPPAEEPPPPPPPPPPRMLPPTARKPGVPPAVPARGTSRRGTVDVAAPIPTGSGKIILAFFLMIIPVVACPILYNGRGGLRGPSEQIGQRFSKGFFELYRKISPPPRAKATLPPEDKKPEAPAEEKARPGPEDQKRDEGEIIEAWTKYMREKRTVDQKAVGAADAEKAMIEKEREELKKQLDAINALRERYKKTYGKDFDPQNQ